MVKRVPPNPIPQKKAITPTQRNKEKYPSTSDKNKNCGHINETRKR